MTHADDPEPVTDCNLKASSAWAVCADRLGSARGQASDVFSCSIQISSLKRASTGSTRLAVENKRPKVSVLKDHIEQMGLGTQVAIRHAPLADANVARLLRSCDYVFGCTDDHLGRLILNRFAYFYYVPVIDTGLSVVPREDGRTAHISGRVTVLRPGVACLLCRGVVNPHRAREQGLRHKRPDEYARQVKEGYITGSDRPTPVVGTFTTETAAAAVNELLAGIGGLRGNKGWASERTIRYDLDRCRPTGCEPRPGCSICADTDVWGRGDVQPLLDLGAPETQLHRGQLPIPHPDRPPPQVG